MFHARASSWLAGLTESLLSGIGKPDERSYSRRDGYHVLDFDRHQTFRRFEAEAPAVLDAIVGDLPNLAEELAGTICQRKTHMLSAIREGSWILAHANDMMADLRLSKPHADLIVASPGFALIRNVDRMPLRMKLFRCAESFEMDEMLDLASAQHMILAPGETFALDGFRYVATMEERGVLVAGMTTLPLGAYDCIFSLRDGRRVGMLSSELRTSALVVVLRLFGAAAWQGAECLLPIAEASHLRELRWGAMNYAWRADMPGLQRRLEQFAADPDFEISRIAASCLAALDGARSTEVAA